MSPAQTGQPPDENIEIQTKLVTATIALVIVGALQFLALVVQAIVFRRTLGKIKTQADQMERQTRILEKSVSAAEANAVAAKEGAEVAKQNTEMMISKERARVQIQPVDIRLPADIDDALSPPPRPPWDSIPIKLFNYGSTAALITRAWGAVEITDSEEPPGRTVADVAALRNINNIEIDQFFKPNFEGVQTHVRSDERFDWGAVNRRQSFIHFSGCIAYSDLFDGQHRTIFRYRWKVTELRDFNGAPFSYWERCGEEADNSET